MELIIGAFIAWLLTLDPLQIFALIFVLLAIAFLLSVGMAIEWCYKKIKQAFLFLFPGFSKETEAGATE